MQLLRRSPRGAVRRRAARASRCGDERGATTREYVTVGVAVSALLAGALVAGSDSIRPAVTCALQRAVSGVDARCEGDSVSAADGFPGGTGRTGWGQDEEYVVNDPNGTLAVLTPNATTTVYSDSSLTFSAPPVCWADQPTQRQFTCASSVGTELLNTADDLRAALVVAGCPDLPGRTSYPPGGRLDLILVEDLSGPAAYLSNPTGTSIALDDLPEDDPVLLAAVGAFLVSTLYDEYGSGIEPGQTYRAPRTADQELTLLNALAEPISVITDILGDVRGDLDCDAVTARLAALSTDVVPGGATYRTVCSAPRLDGSCNPRDFVAVPLETAPDTDPEAQYVDEDGRTIALSPELARAVPGIVPGRPTATFAEATAYCRDFAAACAAELERRRYAAAAETLSLFRWLGVCESPDECRQVAVGLNSALQAPQQSVGRQPLAYPNPFNYPKLILNGLWGGLGTSLGAASIYSLVNGANQTLAGTANGSHWSTYLAAFVGGSFVTGIFETIGYWLPDRTAPPGTPPPAGTPPPGGGPPPSGTPTPPPGTAPPRAVTPANEVVIEMVSLSQLPAQAAQLRRRQDVRAWLDANPAAPAADRIAAIRRYLALTGRAGPSGPP